jgi:hypothetical protein
MTSCSRACAPSRSAPPPSAVRVAASLVRAAGAAALLALSSLSGAQEMLRTFEDGGHVFTYTQRDFPPGERLVDPGSPLAPDTPLNTSTLLGRHLAAGNIEEAALLSNEPKRRFTVLRDYRESVGEEEFKRIFARYFLPGNRIVSEIRIGPHSLLVWDLADEKHYAGQYYVLVENRWLVDDVPNESRAKLRQVLLALRAGRK